jgi:hypothetical protein
MPAHQNHYFVLKFESKLIMLYIDVVILLGATRAVTQACSDANHLGVPPGTGYSQALRTTQLRHCLPRTGNVQTQERGDAGGAQPPLNCKDQDTGRHLRNG